VRGEHNSLTTLVVPYVGPTPLLLGFVASLGLVQNSGRSEVTEESFVKGQKVLVDNNAIAEFAGIKEFDGHRMFGLTQYYRQKGFDLPGTRYWPIYMLRRLVPIDPSRATRGKLNYDLSKSEAKLPALEYLFNASKPADLAAVTKKVLVVTPVTVAGDLAKRLLFHDFSLKEVVPMGSIVDDKVKPWSNSFGQQEPLLVFTPDVDVACVYAEEHSKIIDTVIVDMTGRNSGKFASLGELQRMDFQTLVITPERSASELSVEDDDSTIMWEWDARDLSALLWPQDKETDADGIIVRYEHRLQAQSSVVPQTRCIDYPLTDEVFESVRHLKSVAQERGEDSLAELDELVVLAFGVTSCMFRSATLLTENIPSCLVIEKNIKRIWEIARESRYLSEMERTAATNTEVLLQNLFEELKIDNPKAIAVQEILDAQSGQAIICPDRRLLADLEQTYGSQGLRIQSDYAPDDEGIIGGAIIPGWFRKDRMARLLVPPVAQPLTLLLYNPESRWHADFCHERKKSRIRRARCGRRPKVFPSVRGWTEQDRETAQLDTDEHDSGFLRELESIQGRIHAARRKHAYQTAKSDGTEAEVPARLVLFEGGAHAFLRESYKAIVVTHLLDAIVEDTEKENVDVSHKTAKKLKPNDVLLFHRRSDRNVIRMTADEDMPEGLRETAMAWQKALVNYAQRENLKPQEIRKRLRNAGCAVHIQTIRGWLHDIDRIAPRQYERDIGIIAKVTGDPYLNNNLETVLDSVSAVFGAHQRASHKLAAQVLRRAIRILRDERHQSELIELESDIVLARIIEIDEYDTDVRLSMVNRLQESEQWHI
jgi:hypothetical protein